MMTMTLIEELKWRGMIQDIIPETEKHFEENKVRAYVGVDPTADSLHIGHLVSVMLLKHLKTHGHKCIALVGGATAMIGDPSGKSEERNLLDTITISENIKGIEKQFEYILGDVPVFNNKDWFQEFTFLSFMRDIGKHIPLSYMLNKTSVKKRLESQSGISFTEFTYQLVQGYDFLHLFQNHNCTVQIGGSDQWGNMTTGTELIRRIDGGTAFGFTCPLLTKADGTKFGKTESGTIWLDSKKTSPYAFFQFWLNSNDNDAEKYIKIFTTLKKEEIDSVIEEHNQNRGLKTLQRRLAREVTTMVHGKHLCNHAEEAGKILFSENVIEQLEIVGDKLFDEIFDGVPRIKLKKDSYRSDCDTLVNLLTVHTNMVICSSKREAREFIGNGAIHINKTKIEDIEASAQFDLLRDKFILIQKGKRKNFIIELT